MRIEPIDRSRITAPRMSEEWIAEYLLRRGLTREKFVELGHSLSQSELQYAYRMQKSDVGAILRKLGVNTSSVKSDKIAKSNREGKRKRDALNSENYRKLLGSRESEILEHMSKFGQKDSVKQFGEEAVRFVLYLNPDFSSGHSSTLRANILDREAQYKYSDITQLMTMRKSIPKIAALLDLSEPAVSRIILSLDSNYSPERTEEEIVETTNKLRNAALKMHSSRVKEAIEQAQSLSDEVLRDFFARDLLYVKGVSDVLKISEREVVTLYQSRNMSVESLTYENTDYVRFRNFAKSNGSYGAPEWMINSDDFKSQEVPFYAVHHSDLYRALQLSLSQSFVQSVIESQRVRNVTELTKYFNFWRMQTYLETVICKMDVGFVEETLDEWILRTRSVSADDLAYLITENVSKVKSLRSLCNLIDAPCKVVSDLIKDRNIATDFKKMSAPESVVSEILDAMEVDYILHDRQALNGLEVDILLPQVNIGIEINPTYSHNSSYGYHPKSKPRPSDYHLSKSKLAAENGISLIHIYDSDLLETDKLRAFLKQRIIGSDRVFYGRQVKIEEITSRASLDEARDFLRLHHRQSIVPASKYLTVRVKSSGELVGVASFSPVSIHGADWELKRLCFASGVQVRFGISKVVAAFSTLVPEAKRLLTYSNIDYGYSDSYERSGFDLIGETGPSLTWINPNDPSDNYSWSVATSWSAKQGVIAQKLGPMDITSKEAEEIVETQLPRRKGTGKGYLKLYRAGSKILVKDFKQTHMQNG